MSLAKLFAFTVCTIFFLKAIKCSKGTIKEVHKDQKFVCSSLAKTVYTVVNEMQCVHRCLRHEKCKVLNFKGSTTETLFRDNCEVYAVYDKLNNRDSCSTNAGQRNWKAMILEVTKLMFSRREENFR